MVFSKYNKDRPFLLITRRATPPIGARTENKGWSAESGWHVEEEISIVDKVEDKHIANCTVILDILRRRLVKNQFAQEAPEDEVIKHYLKVYKSEITEGIRLWTAGHTEEVEESAEEQKLIQDVEDELHDIEIKIRP